MSGGTDDLAIWIKEEEAKNALLLDEEADLALVQQALRLGYQSNDPEFTDREVIKIGRDAFLVAYGLVNSDRTVVTKEVTKSTQRRGATRLPDACDIKLLLFYNGCVKAFIWNVATFLILTVQPIRNRCDPVHLTHNRFFY